MPKDAETAPDTRPAPAGGTMIAVERVTKSFGRGERAVRALDEVSVTIRRNEFFTLLGPSGCGKTTLLRLIAGLELPTAGEILLDGQEIGHLPPYKRPVNTVFQSYALFPHMTVSQNISFGLEMQGWARGRIAEIVERMLALVRMEALADRRTDQLSGGQQQRVALARALAPHPKVLLLDEPLSALDLKLRKQMQMELKRLQGETGITFVFVTHDQEEALTMSDRIAVMEAGRILQVGSPHDIYDRPSQRFVADFIGDINILEGRLIRADGTRGEVELAGAGRLPAALPESGVAAGPVSLAVRPENLRLTAPDDPARMLSGRVEQTVYFGAACNVHVALDGGSSVVVRAADAPGPDGTAVGLVIPDGRLRVLAD